MKEIKLKVWDAETKAFLQPDDIDVYWNCTAGILTAHLEDKNGDWRELEIVRHTGLCDKNGVEIYEGDVVVRTVFSKEKIVDTGIVEYHNETTQYAFKKHCYLTLKCDSIELEVLGNIFEHPELLTP